MFLPEFVLSPFIISRRVSAFLGKVEWVDGTRVARNLSHQQGWLACAKLNSMCIIVEGKKVAKMEESFNELLVGNDLRPLLHTSLMLLLRPLIICYSLSSASLIFSLPVLSL